MFSQLQKGCHENGTISPVLQHFSSGITQFLNPEILSFHLMYDAACSTDGWVTPKMSHLFSRC